MWEHVLIRVIRVIRGPRSGRSVNSERPERSEGHEFVEKKSPDFVGAFETDDNIIFCTAE